MNDLPNDERATVALEQIRDMIRVVAAIQGHNAGCQAILLALIRSHPDRKAFSEALQSAADIARQSLEELEYSHWHAQKALQKLLTAAEIAAEPGDASS